MPDLDTELRRLAEAMVGQAPSAPMFGDLAATEPAPSGPGRRRLVLAVTLMIALVAGVVVLVVRHDAPSRKISTPASESRYDAICRDDPGSFTGENGATFGTLGGVDLHGPPDPRLGPGGEITPEMIADGPEFTALGCPEVSGRIFGWVKAADILKAQQEKPLPEYYTVYDRDGTTIVGHYYLPDNPAAVTCGFVGIHEDLSVAPCPTRPSEPNVEPGIEPTTTVPSLPPAGEAQPDDTAAARDAVIAAYQQAYTGTNSVDVRRAAVEDAEELKPLLDQARAQNIETVTTLSIEVGDVTFLDATRAAVMYRLSISASWQPWQVGYAQLDAGTWKVSRETTCAGLQQGGITCPPRSK